MSLLSRLNLKPLVIIKPSTLPLVRVAIQPARAGRHLSAARLDITFSRELGKQIGITASGQKAAIYVDGQFVALCDPDAGRKLFGAGTKEYQVGVKNEKAENAALHFASALPPACLTEKCPTQGPKQIEVENGVLIIELPDSFIRPEYLTGAEASSPICETEPFPPAGTAPAPQQPEGAAPRLGEPETIPVPPAQDDVLRQPSQPQPVEAGDDQIVDVATQIPDEAVEPEGPASAHSSVDDAGLQTAEHCITDPAPAPEKVAIPPTLEDRLYTHLLLLAREGKPCPDNQALATHVNSNPNSISATLSMMKSRGRVSVCYVSAEGERRNEVVRGWQRVFTMLADKMTTAAPQPVNAPQAETGNAEIPADAPMATPPKTVAPAAPPRRVPLTPSKGRQLSEAELELQEVVGARKPVAPATDVDADFEYLRDKKVPVFRVPSNKTHPFRLNDRPATAAEITARAARVRQISGGR
ncbi:hypothetical protein [Azospirillum aestuarii]|uniref:hypothetical protein n=1 Tax=Azospirillum aestuarii TaxID=2802052 RepID=UPI0040550399